MSLGKSKQKSSSTQALTPNNDSLLGNLTDTKAYAAQPVSVYSGEPLDLSGARDSASALAGFSAPSIGRSSIRDVSAGNVGQDQIAQFLDPYLSQVVDATRGDMDYAREVAQKDNAGRVAARGAFGNGRRGIYEAEIDAASERSQGTVLGGLRSQGFTTAVSAAQTEASRALQAAMANQGVDLSVEQANQLASIQSAGVRAQGAGLLGQLNQAQYGAEYQEFARQREEEMNRQKLLQNAYGLLYSGPLTTSTSKGSGFNVGIPQAPQ